jgi:hypothetical protein
MKINQVAAPSRRQLFVLRLMIVIGLLCMGFFLNALLNKAVMGYRPLYLLLLLTFFFTSFKIMYEWYHYWSISIPEVPPPGRLYTVDVFTTYCAGEPYEMIVETLTAIQAITYPHQTYLCDEEDDPYLKSVCEKLGVHHITRTKKIDAKAGNINNALRRSTGELCVVLDPDHIPEPVFLDHVVAYFANPQIGYVQIVQAYYNQNTSRIAKGAAQQTYQFYGPMMMSMNSYGTVQAIGANCTFRRTALASIGGHAAGLAEDMHTAMQLHARKWQSVYVPRVLTKGLVPATLSAYYQQQLKWSRGVMELFVTTYFKLFSRFTLRQKLHYGLLPLFYLSGFVFLINFLVPVVSLFADVFPLRMDFVAFLLVSIPFINAVVLIRHYVQRWVMEDNERGFQIVGGLLLIGTWWVFILGVVYTAIRKKVPYIPTPKDIKDEKTLIISLPNIGVLAISMAAIVYGLINDWNPFTFFMAGIAGLNCLFMVFMLITGAELKLQQYFGRYRLYTSFTSSIKTLKGHLWLLRRKIYNGVRSAGLMLTVLIICISVYLGTGVNTGYNDTSFAAVKRSLISHPGEKPLTAINKADSADVYKMVKQYEALQQLNKSPVDSIKGNRGTAGLKPDYFLSTRGVIYSKGQFWYKNAYPLTKKTIDGDFAEIKKTGINTIKIYGPNVYDHLIFIAAHRYGLKIDYSFWIPDPISFIGNTDKLKILKEEIMATINDNKTDADIKAWNLGNSTLQQLDNYYRQPALGYARYNYIKWLTELVKDIKLTDSLRPLTVDVEASPTLSATIGLLRQQVPQINAFGIIVHDRASFESKAYRITAPYFLSSLNPEACTGPAIPPGGTFYARWQDQQAATTIAFDGLKDIWGRNKPYLYQLSKSWQGHIAANNLPPVKILRPAITAVTGDALYYTALVYVQNKWAMASSVKTGLTFEWYLVRTDEAGNAIAVNALGNGPYIKLNIPPDMAMHRLRLVASMGSNIIYTSTTLNLPLRN